MVIERKGKPIIIRRAQRRDIPAIAKLGSEAFSGLRPRSAGMKWVIANWRARPRMGYWVAVEGERLLGYILWIEKGGFRRLAVFELEQIAVLPSSRRKGIGASLITSSLKDIQAVLKSRHASLKLVEITTGSEQGALEFYRRTLGAKVAGVIPDMFRGDEYILIARTKAAGPT